MKAEHWAQTRVVKMACTKVGRLAWIPAASTELLTAVRWVDTMDEYSAEPWERPSGQPLGVQLAARRAYQKVVRMVRHLAETMGARMVERTGLL